MLPRSSLTTEAGTPGSCFGSLSILAIAVLLVWLSGVQALSQAQLASLRQDTAYLFYHGYDNYMKYAFPEDELRPISCQPLTRDASNPANIGLNDPLGNYSLTLVDSLSTLAILASASGPGSDRTKALGRFQEGVADLVELYGDGSGGAEGAGTRGRGFDMDSKVQVFETVIRGVGGLLSAHLFSVGDLPITGYDPSKLSVKGQYNRTGIRWSNTFSYDGQLLRLAHDLAQRMLPAFSTSTGIPYPRVNLRYGVPFYANSPASCRARSDIDEVEGEDLPRCPSIPPADRELTETCSAGAGSLVLEFTVLSRLTGDPQFERLAKRAFWSVWDRRGFINLVGSGIDAETGLWQSPFTGIGAGVDSFYEYAMKSYILLSGTLPNTAASTPITSEDFEPPPLNSWQESADAFLDVWQQSQEAIKRHLYRGENFMHPHYIQSDLFTGAARAFWIDSLSAFYPGVLTLAGEVEEAAVTHMLFAALWTRYSAIPERWSTATAAIEGGLGWWGGRPEFIESTYYLYRATKDPWYLHVGEMTLLDIKRRCWTPCGWAGIQNVKTGELTDRMESFFLGETAKYLHLLFDSNHPLNKLDSSWVFTTEGHPLVIPRAARHADPTTTRDDGVDHPIYMPTCPVPSPTVPFSLSNIAARKDLFHAAALARLHLMPSIEQIESPQLDFAHDHPSSTLLDVRSPMNYTFYPWTLPSELIPYNGSCSAMLSKPTFDITFPQAAPNLMSSTLLQRVIQGILINSMSGLRLSMIQDVAARDKGTGIDDLFRVQSINNVPLGKDEKLFLLKDTMANVIGHTDPNFRRVRDSTHLDLVLDIPDPPPSADPMTSPNMSITTPPQDGKSHSHMPSILAEALENHPETGPLGHIFDFLASQVSSRRSTPPTPTSGPALQRFYVPAITPTGPGAEPLPDVREALPPEPGTGKSQGDLLWNKVYVAGLNCDAPLPQYIARKFQVLILRRGGCSFSEKLENIPSFPPSSTALQLVVVVSDSDDGYGPVGGAYGSKPKVSRPLLDQTQKTSSGLMRRHPIPMIMVGGGNVVYEALSKVAAVGIKRRYSVHAQGIPISNVYIL